MKAVRFEHPGEPCSVLMVTEQELPPLNEGEVRVRMLASPVNPSDLMYVRGHYTIPATCPATPGFEGVGVVTESRGGLKGRFFTGKRVAVLNPSGGNWAEFATVPVHTVIPLSNRLSEDQAATFFVNPATAWVMTQSVLRIPQGQWLLQTAAGSSLGRMIIRLGKHLGFRTLNVVRRQETAEELLRAGADAVIVFNEKTMDEEDFVRQIHATIREPGVLFAIDAVGGKTGSAVIRSLGNRGRMLAYGTLSGQPLQFSPRLLMTKESRVEGFWLGNFISGTGLIYKLRLIRRLTSLILSGVLHSEVTHRFALDEIAKAVQSAENSASSGKVLLSISRQ